MNQVTPDTVAQKSLKDATFIACFTKYQIDSTKKSVVEAHNKSKEATFFA